MSSAAKALTAQTDPMHNPIAQQIIALLLMPASSLWMLVNGVGPLPVVHR
jgi:hypothetical protein